MDVSEDQRHDELTCRICPPLLDEAGGSGKWEARETGKVPDPPFSKIKGFGHVTLPSSSGLPLESAGFSSKITLHPDPPSPSPCRQLRSMV